MINKSLLNTIDQLKLSNIAEIIMGQSPKGESYNKDGIGVPLINGPTEFGETYPRAIQWTNKPTKYAIKNDILICVRGSSIGKMNLANDTYCIGRGIAAIRPLSNDVDHNYLQFLIEKNVSKILVNSTGSTFPNLSGAELKSFPISIPSKNEQQKIGLFFNALNQKIQFQQEKVDLLKEQKKGFVQKILSRQLRFKNQFGKAFEDWKFINLGKLTKKTGKKNSAKIKHPVAAISNKKGFTLESERNNSNANVDISSYKLVYRNEFAYNPSRINVGSFGFQNVADVAIVSSLYVIFETTPELLNAYLKTYMHTPYFNADVIKNTEGSVREYLFYENFSNIKIPLPCIEEQQKIADFLLKFEDKIILAEEKLASLNQQKQAFMQKMFV